MPETGLCHPVRDEDDCNADTLARPCLCAVGPRSHGVQGLQAARRCQGLPVVRSVCLLARHIVCFLAGWLQPCFCVLARLAPYSPKLWGSVSSRAPRFNGFGACTDQLTGLSHAKCNMLPQGFRTARACSRGLAALRKVARIRTQCTAQSTASLAPNRGAGSIASEANHCRS